MALTIEEIKICVIIRIITGFISFAASFTIMIMIARSTKRLSVTQNRLLFGLSLGDMLASIAIGWGSFAFPKGSPGEWMPMGSLATCDIQGFLFTLGGMMSPLYNAGICIFHFLQVCYNITEDTMSRKVEPFLHFIPTFLAITVSTHQLVETNYNPRTVHCISTDYPRHCSTEPDIDCERGENYINSWSFALALIMVFILTPILIGTTMSATYYRVRKAEKELNQMRNADTDSSTTVEHMEATARMEEETRHSRMVMYRGLAFSAAWLSTFLVPIITFLAGDGKFSLELIGSFFNPLQGFFNFLVYIYPKVALARRRNPHVSCCGALIEAIQTRWGRHF